MTDKQKKTVKPTEPKRPTEITPELTEKITNLVSQGLSQRKICLKNNMPCRTILKAWIRFNKEFATHYARAKEEMYEDKLDQLSELESELLKLLRDDSIDNKTKNALVQAYKLKIDNLKWILVRLMPQKYGDKMQIDNKHDVTGDLKKMLQERFKAEEI